MSKKKAASKLFEIGRDCAKLVEPAGSSFKDFRNHQTSVIAKTSHGSIHQENLRMKKEEEIARLKALEAQSQIQEATVVFPEVKRDIKI